MFKLTIRYVLARIHSLHPDVPVDRLKKSNYSSVKLSRKYYGVSGKHLKLSRKRWKLLIHKKKPDRKKRTDVKMNGKRCSARKWSHGKKAGMCMKKFSCKESKYSFCPHKLSLEKYLIDDLPNGRKVVVDENLADGWNRNLEESMLPVD